jgi:uncharacterized protein (DUF2461 family)
MVDPDTFTFLTDLAANNRKIWLDAHREERDDAMRNFTGIAMTLHDYADRFDPFVTDAGIKPKQSYTKFFQEPRDRVGRALYRADVDVFANAGHPREDVGYYLHIEPGNCYAGAGLFQPSKDVWPTFWVIPSSNKIFQTGWPHESCWALCQTALIVMILQHPI